MRLQSNGILVILFIILSLLPYNVRAYSGISALPFFLVLVGIMPFVIGFIFSIIYKRYGKDKQRIYFILLAIFASIISLFAYSSISMDITSLTNTYILFFLFPIFILNSVIGFKMVELKKRGLIYSFLYLLIISPMAVFFLSSLTTSFLYIASPSQGNTYLPESGFIEIGNDYIYSGQPIMIDGDLAYVARVNYSQGTFVFYKGHLIGNGYDSIGSLSDINGKITYLAKNDDGKRFLVYNGEEMEYDYVTKPTSINGKIAYVAGINNSYVLIYDNETLGSQYETISDLSEINGKLAYVAGQGCKHMFDTNEECDEYFIVYDGQEIGKQYDKVSNPTEIKGKLAYVASEKTKCTEYISIDHTYCYYKDFIIYDGQEIGKQYDTIESLSEIGGELTYVATVGAKSFIVQGTEEIGKQYQNAVSPTEINGKLAYEAYARGSLFMMPTYSRFIVYDGQEIGKQYGVATEPISINGKLAYKAGTTSGQFVVYDNNVLGKGYEYVYGFGEVGGKLYYTAEKHSNKDIIVMEK